MVNAEEWQRYFWYFFGVMGVVFFWTGIWDGVGEVWYLQNPLVSLAVGLIMLFIGGLVKKTDNVKKQELLAHNTLRQMHHHPSRHEFHFKYLDKVKKREVMVGTGQLQRIEKGFLVLLEKGGREAFIPIHRVTEVLRNGKMIKRLK